MRINKQYYRPHWDNVRFGTNVSHNHALAQQLVTTEMKPVNVGNAFLKSAISQKVILLK